jgi:hypothetical protein
MTVAADILDGGGESGSFTSWPRCIWEVIPDTQWIGGWLAPRTYLDAAVKRENLFPFQGIWPSFQRVAYHD